MSDPLAAGEWVLYGAEASPYFLKIEMVLRFLQIPYRRVPEHGSFRETLYYRRRTALVRKGLVSLTWPQMTEFDEFPEAAQDTILANALVLEREGPSLGRPHVDTLNNSKHANMKELRYTVDRGV